MNTLATALLVEHRKLRRSLALLLAASVPLLIAVFLFFNLLRGHQARPWQQDMQMGAAIWAFFMLPMGVTALTVLVAQVEHVPRSWDHLRALPVPRWHFFLTKAAWVLGIVALMSAGVLAGSAAALYLAGRIEPAVAPQGPLDMGYCALLYGRMYLSAFLLVAVQLWLALRYASFVPALAAGIGGTSSPWWPVRRRSGSCCPGRCRSTCWQAIRCGRGSPCYGDAWVDWLRWR